MTIQIFDHSKHQLNNYSSFLSASKCRYSFFIQESVAFMAEIETQSSNEGDKARHRGGEWGFEGRAG